MPKISIVIPTYNERENLPRLMSRLLDLGPDVDILMVDDNSPDGTAAEVEAIAQGQSQGRPDQAGRQDGPGLGLHNRLQDGARPGRRPGRPDGRGFLPRSRSTSRRCWRRSPTTTWRSDPGTSRASTWSTGR